MTTKQLSFPREKIKILLLEGVHSAAAERFAEYGYKCEIIKKALTEEELLKAFDETQHWASRTADGFVGLKHFLVNVLGNKRGFAYAPSAAMVNALVDRGVFEIFDVPSNSGGAYNVKAIRRKSVMPI